MKKTLIALAVLSATSAFAQVTMTGVVRAGFQKSNATANPTGLALTDVTVNLAAAEDLGGGMKASTGVTFDQSSGSFGNALNRRNTNVQLQGGFGLVRFDQTRSTDLITRAWVAPSNLDQGIYDGSGIVNRGAVDVLTYGMAFGPVTASIQYAEAGTAGTATPTLTTTVLNVGYANGPLAAGFAIKNGSGAATATFARTVNNEAFVTYDFGVAKVGLGWDGAAAAASSAVNDASAVAFGVSVPVTSALTLGANYASRDVNNTSEFAANYALSKRTVFNASYGRQTAKENATTTADQFRISLAHNF
ncbi:MAG: porin [Rhodoferax sp.]|uniref:porin n=1 Tax=Rhodoferax sp. TaxID=50421 RepID=UPI002ACE4131|nr:porin [Rhodoferax sp.]MDZ7893318.1 porin [Rhodoferax sp.]